MINRKAIGSEGEEKAILFLKKQGFKILEKNYRCKIGEIDIIATKNDLISFVEVKTRRSEEFGHPEESVNRRKRKKIINTAKYYLMVNNLYYKKDVRFDILSIIRKKSEFEIDFFENAFREER
jgi:putative endonuclease